MVCAGFSAAAVFPGGRQWVASGGGPLDEVPEAERFLLPQQAFSRAAAIGVVNVATDRSGAPRFVPLLFEEMEGIKEAQRLRGVDIDGIGLVRKLIAMARMLVPLVMICLNKAQLMEIALQAKAFTGSGDRTYLHPTRERLSLSEKLLTAVFLLAPVVALALRLFYGFGGSVL